MPILRSAFLALSRNSSLRRFSEGSTVGRRISSRFVAGTSIEDALRCVRTLNDHGAAATIDSLGENVESPEGARAAGEVYHRLLDAIQARGLDANVSVKLTQMGMGFAPDLARTITADLVRHAAEAGSFVRIDMEGAEYTQATLDLVRQLHRAPGHGGSVGVVIQAYLYRSEADIAQLIEEKIRVRLCKGAYSEPPEVAFPEKSEVDANFIRLMKSLLTSGIFHGIATHDERMIAAALEFSHAQAIHNFEFQMLYGVRRDLQQSLIKKGHRVRVYVPFGPDWYPYFMRRLAERPANAVFLAKNLFRR